MNKIIISVLGMYERQHKEDRKEEGEEVMGLILLGYLAYKYNIYYQYKSICFKNS